MSAGKTTSQIREVINSAMAPLRILYIWPTADTSHVSGMLMRELMGSGIEFTRMRRDVFDIEQTGATIEIVPATRDAGMYLSGVRASNIAVVIDHAVTSGNWFSAAHYLAAAVEASMERRP